METTQTTRQQKIARQIQRDIAEILQKEGKAIVSGSLVTVTTVHVSPDLAYVKAYFSIFPFERSEEVMKSLDENNWFIRRELGRRCRNQLKIVPELQFFLDDSLEYIKNIDTLLKE
ncbi:MAG: 30S ribosome-binding factor RbfA [Alistipes sp.]|nr:30S ribosome-binding factor RbfA [Alistipes sp.]